MKDDLNPKSSEASLATQVTSYISDQYLSAAVQLTVRQLIDDPEQWQPPTKDRLLERLHLLLQRHTPVAYEYFLSMGDKDGKKLAFGTVNIIVREVRKERPLFAVAVWKN